MTCLVARLQPPAPDQINHEQGGQHDHRNNRRKIEEKVVERQSDGRTDHDVGWITDQGRGTADVGGKDLREQVRIRIDLQLFGDQQGDRGDQQYRGHIVQKG